MDMVVAAVSDRPTDHSERGQGGDSTRENNRGSLSGHLFVHVLDRVGPAGLDSFDQVNGRSSGVLYSKAPAVGGPSRVHTQRSIKQRGGVDIVDETCYISGKEFVDHRTRVQTMYAPAGDV